MVDELQCRPLDGHRLEREQPHHAVAHVADGRIGDEPFEIGLHEGDERPVDDARHAETEEPRGGGRRSLGQHRQREPQKAVDAQLEEDAGQIDAAAGGRLDVGQRQPGVEGNDRHLDGEADEQRDEDDHLQPPPLTAHRQGVGRHARGEPVDVEGHAACVGGVPEDDRQQAEKREHAAGERVEKELDRRPAAVVVPPDADQKEQRHEGELEEHVEQDHVAGGEDAEHRRLEHQQEDVEADGPVLDRLPAHHHRRQREQGREAEQPERQSVETERQPDVEHAVHEPGRRDHGVGPAESGLRALQIAEQKPSGADERDDRRHGSALADRMPAAGAEQPGHDRAHQRGGDDEKQMGARGNAVHGWCRWGGRFSREVARQVPARSSGRP